MTRIFGWDEKPLLAEQKVENLWATVENTLAKLKEAYRTGNRLAYSTFQGMDFNWTDGYRMDLTLGAGQWSVWSTRIGSAGDERHQYPFWNGIQQMYDRPPIGFYNRTFSNGVPRTWETVSRFRSEDDVLAAGIARRTGLEPLSNGEWGRVRT